MDGRKNTLEGAGEYIWLRYSTTITLAGRPRTVEIGVPMPIGADEEAREQLLREADAGMNQVMGHVENRIAQLLQRVQPTQGNIPAPTPTAKPSVNPPPRPLARPASAPQVSQQNAPVTNNGGQRATPATATQPPAREVRETRAEPLPASPVDEEGVAPQSTSRGTTGVSMQTTGEVSGNLSIPQFIRVVKDRFDLNPTQAMEMLKLKSLSGVNLREKLDQLQRIVTPDANGEKNTTFAPDAAFDDEEKPVAASETPSGKLANTANLSAATKPPVRTNTSALETNGRGQASRPPTTPNTSSGRNSKYFDEEEDFDDVLAELEEEGELDANEHAEQGETHELTPQERLHAKNLISRFRESQGAAVANPARLRVLSNVTDGQISEEQTQDLIQGIWNMSSLKKLKVDQVELLISWAKEDDFMTDVEVVLMLLEEEALAGGNR